MTRPFRMGVQASTAASHKEWTDLARRVEDLGYHVLSVADHLDGQFAITPALAAAAGATTEIRLAAMVYCNDFRHPVITAKEAATLDVLSGGRLELGLGAGWMTTDYAQGGIPMDGAGTRIERLAEALTVVRGLWADEPCTHEGEHYRVTGLDGRPKPLQRPGPPIFVGGGGRRILSLAAREADIVGLNIRLDAGQIDASAGPTATAASTEEKIGWLRAAAGDRFDDLELQTRIHLASITDDRPGLAEAVGPAFGMSPAEALVSPHALAGSVTEIVEQCLERRERYGISYITISADALEAFAPVVARLRAV